MLCNRVKQFLDIDENVAKRDCRKSFEIKLEKHCFSFSAVASEWFI
jgi:hypothetical protein